MQNPLQLFSELVWESSTIGEQLSKARNYMEAFRRLNEELDAVPDQDLLESVTSEFQCNAIASVYFSNYIEHSEMSSEETYTLCIEHLKGLPPIGPDDDDIIDRLLPSSLFQHMDAFLYLYDRVIVQKRPLDEQIIKKAHKIMMFGLVEDAGSYRKCPVYVDNRQFLHEERLPAAMSTLIQSYNSQVNKLKGEALESYQPFYLAAKLSYDFGTIHPFLDGNGRLCRLLLNIALLSKSIPFCVALGYSCGHKKARAHYFQCIQHARTNDGIPSQLASVVLYSYCAVAVDFFEKVRLGFPEYYKLVIEILSKPE